MFRENLEGLILMLHWVNEPPPNPVSMRMAQQSVRLEDMYIVVRIYLLPVAFCVG